MGLKLKEGLTYMLAAFALRALRSIQVPKLLKLGDTFAEKSARSPQVLVEMDAFRRKGSVLECV